jgi:hypothetical protein
MTARRPVRCAVILLFSMPGRERYSAQDFFPVDEGNQFTAERKEVASFFRSGRPPARQISAFRHSLAGKKSGEFFPLNGRAARENSRRLHGLGRSGGAAGARSAAGHGVESTGVTDVGGHGRPGRAGVRQLRARINHMYTMCTGGQFQVKKLPVRKDSSNRRGPL